MVTIYALINPFNNEPFYVGSTVNPKSRLTTHYLCNEGTIEKRQLIKEIKRCGKAMMLLPLIVCTEKVSAKCEVHVYQLLVSNGYVLYNDMSRVSSRQNYSCPSHWLKSPYIFHPSK